MIGVLLQNVVVLESKCQYCIKAMLNVGREERREGRREGGGVKGELSACTSAQHSVCVEYQYLDPIDVAYQCIVNH